MHETVKRGFVLHHISETVFIVAGIYKHSWILIGLGVAMAINDIALYFSFALEDE